MQNQSHQFFRVTGNTKPQLKKQASHLWLAFFRNMFKNNGYILKPFALVTF